MLYTVAIKPSENPAKVTAPTSTPLFSGARYWLDPWRAIER
jgi:hypothetical protein